MPVQSFELGWWTMQDYTTGNPSLLATEMTKRLTQLMLSRRSLAQTSGLSRQTLHAIERQGHTNLSQATCEALDDALKWPAGTTHELAQGNESAITDVGGLPLAERAAIGRRHMMDLIMTLTDEDLETFVLFVEVKWSKHQEAIHS